jgi:hypothetical protein
MQGFDRAGSHHVKPWRKTKIKTFIVKKTMPTYVTWSYEVIAKNEKEAYGKFIKGDYNHEPVFGEPEIGEIPDADPKIDVKEKEASS